MAAAARDTRQQMAGECTNSVSIRALPAAQQLSSQKVLQLLQAAVELGNACAVTRICELPGAKQLCSSSMAQLEEMAAGKGHQDCLQALRSVARE
jgi:hypothetical protein